MRSALFDPQLLVGSWVGVRARSRSLSRFFLGHVHKCVLSVLRPDAIFRSIVGRVMVSGPLGSCFLVRSTDDVHFVMPVIQAMSGHGVSIQWVGWGLFVPRVYSCMFPRQSLFFCR